MAALCWIKLGVFVLAFARNSIADTNDFSEMAKKMNEVASDTQKQMKEGPDTSCSEADLTRPVRATPAELRAAVKEFKQLGRGASVERSYEAALGVSDKSKNNEMDCSEQSKLVSGSSGLRYEVNGDEACWIDVDYPVFIAAAKKGGKDSDHKYFDLFAQTHDGSGSPKFAKEASHWGSCADYGSGKIAQSYVSWRKLGHSLAGFYSEKASQNAGEIRHWLFTADYCVCGKNPKGVIAELEQLRALLPKSDPDLEEVERSIRCLNQGKIKVTLSCSPG